MPTYIQIEFNSSTFRKATETHNSSSYSNPVARQKEQRARPERKARAKHTECVCVYEIGALSSFILFS